MWPISAWMINLLYGWNWHHIFVHRQFCKTKSDIFFQVEFGSGSNYNPVSDTDKNVILQASSSFFKSMDQVVK